MQLFIDGQLNYSAFDDAVRKGTDDWRSVLKAAVDSQSGRVETTHVLMALGQIPGGRTRAELERLGISDEQWQTGLESCAITTPGVVPDLTESRLDGSTRDALRDARQRAEELGCPKISEGVLLWSLLKHLTPATKELCEVAQIDVADWCRRLEGTGGGGGAKLEVFTKDQPKQVNLSAFSPGARKVLRLVCSEAEALGYKTADARHLLLALLSRDQGPIYFALVHQERLPNKIRNAVLLDLQARAKHKRSHIPLDCDHLRPIVQLILETSAGCAAEQGAESISELHLTRAFLDTENMAHTILLDHEVDLQKVKNTVRRFVEDEEEDEESVLADIETIERRLHERLVGQEQVIGQILPCVQRMRFGFTLPNRPVGVFLFCGPSGSGKTELAKELARAVYGSEESLIFLEMGQFNSPESMNIFIGAPHGYIGFGEGKLTNGLRDKPRSVVLFDEVEKADSKVLDALLRFIDEGQIDDPGGPVRDGTQCIVVLTSNVSAKQIGEMVSKLSQDPGRRTQLRKQLRQEFEKKLFRVEFLNRVDEIVMFRKLDNDNYAEIARRLIQRDFERLRAEHDIRAKYDDDVAVAIGNHCATLDEGARAAARLTQNAVITPIIDFVLRREPQPPVHLHVSMKSPQKDPAVQPACKVELA